MATSASNGVSGISATGAKNIKNAVHQYKSTLLQKSNYWLSIDNLGRKAIQGDSSLKDFTQMVNMFIQDNAKYINYLQQFEDKIDQILQYYKNSDTNNNTFSSDARSTFR